MTPEETKWPFPRPIAQAPVEPEDPEQEPEDEDSLDPTEEDDDESYCPACGGSGEGRYEGYTCSSCGGSGMDRSRRNAS